MTLKRKKNPLPKSKLELSKVEYKEDIEPVIYSFRKKPAKKKKPSVIDFAIENLVKLSKCESCPFGFTPGEDEDGWESCNGTKENCREIWETEFDNNCEWSSLYADVLNNNNDSIGNTEFQIWSEGYSATGEHGTATYHGVVEASSFRSACIKKFKGREDFNPRNLTLWGCQLFSSEADARASFG